MFSPNRTRVSNLKKTYAVLDPTTAGDVVTISADGLTMATSQYGSCISNFGKTSGKWYIEAMCVNASQKATMVGLVDRSTYNRNIYAGAPNNGWAYYFYNGGKYYNDNLTSYSPAPDYGEWVGIYFDLDQRTMGAISKGIDRGLMFSGLTGQLFVIFGNGSSAKTGTQVINFGQTPFVFQPPPGYNLGFYV